MPMLTCVPLFFLLLVLANHTHARLWHDDKVDLDLHDYEGFVMEHDHDAFLGHKLASEFLHLSPVKSRIHLGNIIDEKIDLDHDGNVTEHELHSWLSKVVRQQLRHTSDKTFNNYKSLVGIHDKHHPSLTYDQYLQAMRSSHFGDGYLVPKEKKNLENRILRDQRRMELADRNQDGLIDHEEFLDVIHPEESIHMYPVVIQELLDIYDTNNDSVITLSEYVVRFVPDYEYVKANNHYSKQAQKHEAFFRKKLDKDGDGQLSDQEIKRFALPHNSIFSLHRTKFYLKRGDKNNDGVLGREEMLSHYELYVGSHTAELGKHHAKHHNPDEL